MKNPAAQALPGILSVVLIGVAVASGEPDKDAAGTPRRLEVEPETITVEGVPPERVRLSVSVLDREGVPVGGLVASDFRVIENGISQELIEFGPESERQDRPLSAVFLIDRSVSMGRQMHKWKDACAALLSVLRPIDEVQVATFASEVEVLQPFTSRAQDLAAAVERIEAWGSGGTRIKHALDETLTGMRARRGRKVIFLLTDGGEDGVAEGTIGTSPAVAAAAARAVQSQTVIVTILPGASSHPWLAVQDLAVHTGGWWLYSGEDPVAIVKKLGERLLHSYFMAYDSPRLPGDQTRRRGEVSLARLELAQAVVQTASGVYGDAPLLEHLLEDLKEDDAALRARAAAHLGGTTEKEVRKPLVEALEDQSPGVRGAAAIALAERGDLSAVGPIGRLLNDPDPDARASAVRALGIMLTKAPDGKTRDRILETLESLVPGD